MTESLSRHPDAPDLRDAILRHLSHSLGTRASVATPDDWRVATAMALRDRMVEPWLDSQDRTAADGAKQVFYLSMEFLVGRLMEDSAINLGVAAEAEAALAALGQDYQTLVGTEPDAALGNGGLGRLAACFLDSLSSLAIPATGYGIRYEHGLFRQSFDNGRQVEDAETWLAQRHVWEFPRPERAFTIGFGGTVETSAAGACWRPSEHVTAMAYDTPIIGWQGRWANTLRLWSAKPTEIFDLDRFNHGDFLGANAPETLARTLSRVLYPDDTTDEGKALRLKQEYFFTAASIRDIMADFTAAGHSLDSLPEHVAIQLNDTHPAIAGPELIRVLVDEHGLAMDRAIGLTRRCLGYTNHTLLPEALEAWGTGLFAHLLPRHLEIIRAIDTISPVSIETHGTVRMGELAFVMAHKVNGVSALHTELMKETVFAQLHRKYPDRIVNQTNGVTPRRWIHTCNPALSTLITETIGHEWPADLEQLSGLEAHADDAGFCDTFYRVKQENKARLGALVHDRLGVTMNPDAMVDIQIKRIHEYKRQLMNLLETVALWNAMRDEPNADWTPRVKVFGGKAAPGYVMAKSIIHLINDVARTINADPITRDWLQVIYPANYNVSMAEIMIPAADLSEQISTAGKEASGTGNMKFALNGALTIGTLDGANVEIRERVGEDNFFLFGMTAHEVEARRAEHDYARHAISASPRLSRVLSQIADGVFCGGDRERYAAIVSNMYNHDYFMVTCDFDDYWTAQRHIDLAYRDQAAWTRMAILNTARSGWFSSDRTILGYARDIWDAPQITHANAKRMAS